jgi:hypothetical protein
MLDAEAREDLIERITAIFTNEANAGEFEDDPEGYMPEGAEAEDVDAVLPEVAERTGLDFSNVATSAGGTSAAAHVGYVHETVYQQNTYIYAEEGSQVTNIQGNDNAVAQQDIDVDVDFGEGETDTEPEEPAEPPVILRETDDDGYDGSGINPNGMYSDEGDDDGGYDGSGINPAAGAPEVMEDPVDQAETTYESEAPAEAPADDGGDDAMEGAV